MRTTLPKKVHLTIKILTTDKTLRKNERLTPKQKKVCIATYCVDRIVEGKAPAVSKDDFLKNAKSIKIVIDKQEFTADPKVHL